VSGPKRPYKVVLSPRRVNMTVLEHWARQHLNQADAVVLEASGNAWEVYDLLAPLVGQVSVVHPQHVKLIAASFVKTDKRDALAFRERYLPRVSPSILPSGMSSRECPST
jgi:transposase